MASTFQQNLFADTRKASSSQGPAADPMIQTAQTSAQDAMAFQLWVSEQSHSLARLKIFHTMAKTINDQQ